MKVAKVEDQILELAKRGIMAKDIAQAVGVSKPSVYKVMIRHGIDRRGNRSHLEGKEEEIRSLIQSGEYYASLARRYGITKKQMGLFCRRHKIYPTEEGKANARSASNNNFRRDKVEKMIADRSVSYRYIGGYKNCDSHVTVECTVCGDRHTICFENIRRKNGKMKCKVCAKREAEEKRLFREQMEAEKKEKRKAQRLERMKRRTAEKAKALEEERKRREHPCPMCGEITTRRKYCSEQCAKRVENNKHRMIREAKIRGALVDKDITLQSLYKRDRGVCYICGMATLLDDYTVKDGTTICGDWYPSIDHVKPLAKGGLHAWDNVRLAHRRCNYIKGDM